MRFEWLFPTTLPEAFDCLAGGEPDVHVVAGATALMTLVKRRLLGPARLVSLRRLEPALGGCERLADGWLRIGALARLRDLESSALLAGHSPAVVHALHRVANVRVRHMATVGGSLCYADPHQDLPGLLLALGGEVVAASRAGERRLPLGAFFAGYYQTALRADELLTEVWLPPPGPHDGAAYVKHCALSADDWPAVGASARVCLDELGRITAATIVVSAVGDRPVRIPAAEEALAGADPSRRAFREAAALAAASVEPLDDLRGSAGYKKDLVAVCVRRALEGATGAAAGEG